jgi:hypothetical protein
VNNSPVSLSQGSHLLNLFTSGNPIYLDMVAVTPAGLVDLASKKEIADVNDLQQMYLLEFSNYFTGENAFREANVPSYASDAWSGYLTLKPNSVITQKLFIAKADSYNLELRFLQRPDSGVLTLKVDGKPVLKVHNIGFDVWTWTNSSIYLSAGEHEIEVTNDGGYSSIDLMSLIEKPLMLTYAVDAGPVQYTQVQLNTWQGNLSFSKPAFVIFTESYYPEWIFQLQTENSKITVSPLEAFYFLNAYPIDYKGDVQFTVYHMTSQVRDVSYALSISTFVACATVTIVEILRARIFNDLLERIKFRGKSTQKG